MGTPTEEKLLIERRFADNQLRHADNRTRQAWEATTSGHRFMGYKGKQLVIFRTFLGDVSVIKTLTLQDVSLGFSEGLMSVWVDDSAKTSVLTHTPYEVAPGCFLWHNKMTNLEYTEHCGTYSMRFAMTWRTRFNPKKIVDGCTYMLESAAFKEFVEGSSRS